MNAHELWKKTGIGGCGFRGAESIPTLRRRLYSKSTSLCRSLEVGWVQDKRAGGRNAQFLPSVFNALCLKLHAFLFISVVAHPEMHSPHKEPLGISPPGSAQVSKEQT